METSEQAQAALYRPTAWSSYRRGTELGSPLDLSAGSTTAVYHVLVVAFLVGLVFLVCVPINDNARGRGYVRFVGSRAVTSLAEAPVAKTIVAPGTHVKHGQAIVEQYAVEQQAEVDRLQQEFDTHWVKVLRDPRDVDARNALALAGPALRRAQASLGERIARAPMDGVLVDVRVRPGQHVAKGDTLFVIAPEHASLELVAVLPAPYRPQVTLDHASRFWIQGADSNKPVKLTSIQSDAIGPAEVSRLLGPSVQGSSTIDGMSFVVTGAIEDAAFTADGHRYALYGGMAGDLEVTLDRKPLLFLLVPSLRRWVPR